MTCICTYLYMSHLLDGAIPCTVRHFASYKMAGFILPHENVKPSPVRKLGNVVSQIFPGNYLWMM